MVKILGENKILEIPFKCFGRKAGFSKFKLRIEGPNYVKIILLCFMKNHKNIFIKVIIFTLNGGYRI